jgi:hypothetical protein
MELYTTRRRSSDHFSTEFFLPNPYVLHLVSDARSSEKKISDVTRMTKEG